jgi:hypothetical protein
MAHRATVVVGKSPPTDDSLKLRPGVNLITGEKEFRQRFGPPDSIETDVLTVASAIFAADIAFKRGDRSEFQRRIHLTIPVVNRAVSEA